MVALRAERRDIRVASLGLKGRRIVLRKDLLDDPPRRRGRARALRAGAVLRYGQASRPRATLMMQGRRSWRQSLARSPVRALGCAREARQVGLEPADRDGEPLREACGQVGELGHVEVHPDRLVDLARELGERRQPESAGAAAPGSAHAPGARRARAWGSSRCNVTMPARNPPRSRCSLSSPSASLSSSSSAPSRGEVAAPSACSWRHCPRRSQDRRPPRWRRSGRGSGSGPGSGRIGVGVGQGRVGVWSGWGRGQRQGRAHPHARARARSQARAHVPGHQAVQVATFSRSRGLSSIGLCEVVVHTRLDQAARPRASSFAVRPTMATRPRSPPSARIAPSPRARPSPASAFHRGRGRTERSGTAESASRPLLASRRGARPSRGSRRDLLVDGVVLDHEDAKSPSPALERSRPPRVVGPAADDADRTAAASLSRARGAASTDGAASMKTSSKRPPAARRAQRTRG